MAGPGGPPVARKANVYAALSRLNGLIGGEPETAPITEESPLRDGEGMQGAGYDKLGVERAYAAALPNIATLRLPAVYGWSNRGRIGDHADPMLNGAEEIALHLALVRWRFTCVLSRNTG
jgi:hypothetical protein